MRLATALLVGGLSRPSLDSLWMVSQTFCPSPTLKWKTSLMYLSPLTRGSVTPNWHWQELRCPSSMSDLHVVQNSFFCHLIARMVVQISAPLPCHKYQLLLFIFVERVFQLVDFLVDFCDVLNPLLNHCTGFKLSLSEREREQTLTPVTLLNAMGKRLLGRLLLQWEENKYVLQQQKEI